MVKCAKTLRAENVRIRDKATSFTKKLRPVKVKGSVGWLNNFKDRTGMLHIIVNGRSRYARDIEVRRGL